MQSGNITTSSQFSNYARYSSYSDILALRRLKAVVAGVSEHSLRTHKKNLKILDLGCGTGGISIPLSHMGHLVTGVDVDAESIKTCKNENCHPTAKYLVGDITTLELNENFDVVICSEVLEHSTHPELLLKTLGSHLNPEGIGIISVPNGYAPKEIMISLFFQELGITTLFHKLPNKLYRVLTGIQSPYHSRNIFCDHVQFFSLKKITRLLDEQDFRLLDTTNLGLGIFLDWNWLRPLKWIECTLADYAPGPIAGGWVFIITRR